MGEEARGAGLVSGAGRGDVEVIRLAARGARTAGDVAITRGTVLGNPFIMRGEGERDEAVACYARLLRGGDVYALGRESGLAIHEASARVKHSSRLHAVGALAERAAAGERLRLVCACAPRLCHGHVLKAWIEDARAGAAW